MGTSITDKWPLYKLEALAVPLLIEYPESLRIQFVEVARRETPTQAFITAERLARYYGLSAEEARKVAQATRWLAVIKRDHKKDFNLFLSKQNYLKNS